MEMKRCPNGHFFDQSRTMTCPYCTGESANANISPQAAPGYDQQYYGAYPAPDVGATVPLQKPPAEYGGFAPVPDTVPAPVPMPAPGPMPAPDPIPAPPPPAQHPPDDDRTVAVIRKKIGIDPVVGWLVSIDGAEKGRDYRIHSDNNYIGRAENMDICIIGDQTVSRENQAIISYDGEHREFFLTPGSGRSMVRVNDTAIFATVSLVSGDRIEFGNTKLIFMPLCGEGFGWDE